VGLDALAGFLPVSIIGVLPHWLASSPDPLELAAQVGKERKLGVRVAEDLKRCLIVLELVGRDLPRLVHLTRIGELVRAVDGGDRAISRDSFTMLGLRSPYVPIAEFSVISRTSSQMREPNRSASSGRSTSVSSTTSWSRAAATISCSNPRE
jgi:hypothetical protein